MIARDLTKLNTRIKVPLNPEMLLFSQHITKCSSHHADTFELAVKIIARDLANDDNIESHLTCR